MKFFLVVFGVLFVLIGALYSTTSYFLNSQITADNFGTRAMIACKVVDYVLSDFGSHASTSGKAGRQNCGCIVEGVQQSKDAAKLAAAMETYRQAIQSEPSILIGGISYELHLKLFPDRKEWDQLYESFNAIQNSCTSMEG